MTMAADLTWRLIVIQNIGLAWTFRTLAIICFVVNGIASFFIRDRNQAVSSVHVAFNWKLFKRPSFIMFQLWMTLSLIGYVILVFSIVAYCQAVGLTASQASLVGALFNCKFLDLDYVEKSLLIRGNSGSRNWTTCCRPLQRLYRSS